MEELKKQFYKEFRYIQAIKNEESGNQYTNVADWWISKIERVLDGMKPYTIKGEKEARVADFTQEQFASVVKSDEFWVEDEITPNESTPQ